MVLDCKLFVSACMLRVYYMVSHSVYKYRLFFVSSMYTLKRYCRVLRALKEQSSGVLVISDAPLNRSQIADATDVILSGAFSSSVTAFDCERRHQNVNVRAAPATHFTNIFFY